MNAEDWNVLVADVGLKDWSNALQVFNICTQKSPVWHELLQQKMGKGERSEAAQGAPAVLKMYTTLVRVLSKNESKKEITAIQEQMKQADICPDASFYNALFMSYSDQGQVAEISKGLLQMEEAGIKPDHLTYEALILAYLRGETSELDRPTEILKDMIREGLPVGANTFKKLINAFWKAEDVEGAEKIFTSMQDAGYLADLKGILKLMQLHGRKGNHKRNLELFKMLKKLGIKQTDAAYSYLLHAYCKAGLMKQARQTFGNYQTVTGSKPSLVAFNMIIDACGKQGFHEEAVQYYADLCNSGLEANVVSYCSIISAMVKVGRFKKAEQLYKRMLTKNIQPNLHIYLTMIHCYTKCKSTRLGHELYVKMKDSRIKMTDTAYGTVLALYVEGRWYEHAAVILKQIESGGFNLDTAAHGLLIRSFGTLDNEMAPLAQAVQASQFGICKLLTSLSLANAGSPKMDPKLYDLVVDFLERWEEVDEAETVISLYNAFLDCFWQRGLRRTAQTLLEKARKVYAVNTCPQMHATEWILDVRGLSVGGGKVALADWLKGVEEISTEGLVGDIKMVVMTGGGDFLAQVVEHEDVEAQAKGLKGALLSMLQKLGSPFVESPENPKKLQAPAADVLNWVSRRTVKRDMSLVDCC